MARNGSIITAGARRALSAGLCLALATASPTAALAATAGSDDPTTGEYANPGYDAELSVDSVGHTRVYAMLRHGGMVVNEGVEGASVRVTVPVAIHYLIDDGEVRGPADYAVRITNNTKTVPVHVSNIAFTPASGIELVTDSELTDSSGAEVKNRMSLLMLPQRGSVGEDGAFVADSSHGNTKVENLSAYAGASGAAPAEAQQWDIDPDGGAVALRQLRGKCTTIDAVDVANDAQVGTIKWTIKAGTREQAARRASSVTLRFNANGGTWVGEPRADMVAAADGSAALPDGSGIEPPATEYSGGSTITYTFKGWGERSSQYATVVENVSELTNVRSKAGKSVQLYAIWKRTVS